MDEEQRLDTALFRYRIIVPLLEPSLSKEAAAAIRRRITKGEHNIPHTNRTRIAPRTLRSWLKNYRDQGFEGLRSKWRGDRGEPRRIRPEVLEAATEHKRALPARSVHEIITLLESTGVATHGEVKPSTLARWLAVLEVTRRDLGQAAEPLRRRFEAPCKNALWQGDVMHGPRLPDPQDRSGKERTYLVAWLDDYSRLCTHAAFYRAENLPALEDSLRRAILRCGIPERLYVDNGKIYSSRQFGRITGELGIRPSHATPYHPEGKGKIERFFRTVRQGFLKEATLLGLECLEDLNQLFWAWLEEGYHHRVHSETGQKPAERFAHGPGCIRPADPGELAHVFLWQEDRLVDKTGCISLLGNRYEVDGGLKRKRVQLRFNPYDLTAVLVFYQDQPYDVARPVDLQREVDSRVGSLPTEDGAKPPFVSYLRALEKKHQDRLRKTLSGTPFAKALSKGGR